MCPVVGRVDHWITRRLPLQMVHHNVVVVAAVALVLLLLMDWCCLGDQMRGKVELKLTYWYA